MEISIWEPEHRKLDFNMGDVTMITRVLWKFNVPTFKVPLFFFGWKLGWIFSQLEFYCNDFTFLLEQMWNFLSSSRAFWKEAINFSEKCPRFKGTGGDRLGCIGQSFTGERSGILRRVYFSFLSQIFSYLRCWAFAVADALESRYAIAHNTDPVELSVQQQLDCNHNGVNEGCNHIFLFWIFVLSQF